jgi:signal transduction histidine kinase
MNDTDVPRCLRILLVEDNPHDRRAFHRALRNSHLEVQITDCKRAEEALERLATAGPQWEVIVSDHNLPGASGLDLFREVRRQQWQVPFILLTGVGNEMFAVEALKLGVDDYLSKNAGPAYFEQLPLAISRVRQIYCDRESDRRKDEFLATLAHELRNPLAPLRNALEILRLESTGGPLAARALDTLERQVDHMVRLVDDLLDLSRVMRGKITLHKQTVSLDSIVQRALETSRPIIEARRHELILNLPEHDVWLDADEVRIAQILGNLLTNAAKYTDEGGHIWLQAQLEHAQLTLRVRDDGIGLEPGEQAQIFEVFQQVPDSVQRSHGGLGIGLTLVRRLSEMHGGSVAVFSDGPGRGSEFVVRLPVMCDHPLSEDAPAADAADNAANADNEPIPPLQILVVDDNRDAAEMLTELLRLDGHNVNFTHDPRQALQLAPKLRPDLILLDIGLPGMSGYDVARQLRTRAEFDGTLLVAVTGYGLDNDRRQSRDAGFDEHLVKPVQPHQLQQILRRTVELRHSPALSHSSR